MSNPDRLESHVLLTYTLRPAGETGDGYVTNNESKLAQMIGSYLALQEDGDELVVARTRHTQREFDKLPEFDGF